MRPHGAVCGPLAIGPIGRSRATVRAVRARDDEPALATWDVGNW